MKQLSTSLLADLLTEKIKRDTSESYGQFVNSLNALTEDKKHHGRVETVRTYLW